MRGRRYFVFGGARAEIQTLFGGAWPRLEDGSDYNVVRKKKEN